MEITGKIQKIMGAVVDVVFENGQLPAIMNALTVDREKESTLVLEVSQHLGNQVVRTVSQPQVAGGLAT